MNYPRMALLSHRNFQTILQLSFFFIYYFFFYYFIIIIIIIIAG